MPPSTPLPSSSREGNKVAIPRMDRHEPLRKPGLGPKDDRVARACNECRKRKIKCSGGTPRCSSCQANGTHCAYEQSRRDRLKQATHLNSTIIALLENLKTRVNEDDQQRINAVLEGVEVDLLAPPSSLPTVSTTNQSPDILSIPREENTSQYGESYATQSVGSNEGLDYVQEDLSRNQKSRDTGYVGQNSEVQWLRSVHQQMVRDQPEYHSQIHSPIGSGKHAFNLHMEGMDERQNNAIPASIRYVSDSSFYLDSHDIEVEIAVDPYGLPDPDTAEKLFSCYVNTVYIPFPLLPTNFEAEFRRFIESTRDGRTCRTSSRWRAMMNLVFAIGAKYSHLIKADWKGDEKDHLIYMTRAIHLLGLRNTVMVISGPDRPLVHATGLLAFYFLVIGHVSRAWIMIGLSIRLALALGLHLRNEDPSAADSKKEAMLRTWWSLHAVECLLSSITGRPPVIALEECSVPLPQAKAGEENTKRTFEDLERARTSYSVPGSSASSTTWDSNKRRVKTDQYFSTYVSLNLITQKTLFSLYSAKTATQPWEFVQQRVRGLLDEVDEWGNAAFPTGVDAPSFNPLRESDREQYLFKLYYWSTKILITRPCLCRIERRASTRRDSSQNNAQIAQTCVEAAMKITELLPPITDSRSIYSSGPWWFIVHLIMQSMAVLLLEMVHQGNHAKDGPEIHSSLKRLIEWLRAMKHHDPVAARAYHVTQTILKSCAPSLKSQADILLFETIESVQEFAWEHHTSSFASGKSRAHANINLTADPMVVDSNLDYQHGGENIPSYDLQDLGQMAAPMSFGNPFFTSFDQGTATIDIRNTRNDFEQADDLYVNFRDMHDPEQHVPFDPNLDHWIQQQFNEEQ